MVKKDKTMKDNNATFQSFLWLPLPVQLSLLLFPSMPFWGPATFGHNPGLQCPSDSISVTDQPDSSTVQGQGGAQVQNGEQTVTRTLTMKTLSYCWMMRNHWSLFSLIQRLKMQPHEKLGKQLTTF